MTVFSTSDKHVQLCLGQKSTIWQGSESSLFHFHLPGKYLRSQVAECWMTLISLQQQPLSELVLRCPPEYTI